MAQIRLKNVSKRWNKFIGVDNFNLDIADQEFLVLLGPSGCGKTTTMRMIAGLEEITEGEIWIGDRLVNTLEPKDRDISMVFQSYGLYPNMTVYENIRFPLKVRRIPQDQHHERVMKAAAMVELEPFLERRPAALSGGQRQRVALAEAMTLADRVVVMNKGVVQQVGTPMEIYDRPANTFVASFIGSPAMNLVSGRIDNGVFTSEGIRIEGLPQSASGAVTLGFRAEDASLAQAGGQIEAPIYSVELLGEATMLSMRVAGELVSIKVGKDYRGDIGDVARIAIPASACHLFDQTSGARIEA